MTEVPHPDFFAYVIAESMERLLLLIRFILVVNYDLMTAYLPAFPCCRQLPNGVRRDLPAPRGVTTNTNPHGRDFHNTVTKVSTVC